MASMDGFDPASVPDKIVLPKGTYAAIVISSKNQPTSKGGSQYVFTIKITEGPHAGQILTWRINRTFATNTEKTAVAKAMADQDLKSLCLATIGMRKPTDTVDFHNVTALFKIDQEEYNGQMGNVVKGVSPVNAKPAAIPHPSQQSWNQAPVPPAADGAPAPWAKPATPPTA